MYVVIIKPVSIVQMAFPIHRMDIYQLPSQPCLFLTTIRLIGYRTVQGYLFESICKWKWNDSDEIDYNLHIVITRPHLFSLSCNIPCGSMRSGAMYAVNEKRILASHSLHQTRISIAYVYSLHRWFSLRNRLNSQKYQNRTFSLRLFGWWECLMVSHRDEWLSILHVDNKVH